MLHVKKEYREWLKKNGLAVCRAPRCKGTFRPRPGRELYCCESCMTAAEIYRNSAKCNH
jgi:hypothetical protein